MQRRFTVPELLDLADRMIATGASDVTLKDTSQLKQDCLSCGLLLAHLLLKTVISEAIILGGDHSPPIAPGQTPPSGREPDAP
jgi:hypothetical protein